MTALQSMQSKCAARLVFTHIAVERASNYLLAGMEAGWTQSIDKLQELVAAAA
jgi:hypothetical protein